MTRDEVNAVNQCVRAAAERAAAADSLSVPVIERFLRTGEETWDGAGSGRFALAQFKEDEAYTRAATTALWTLLHLLASLLPAEAQPASQVPPETIRRRIRPMVTTSRSETWPGHIDCKDAI